MRDMTFRVVFGSFFAAHTAGRLFECSGQTPAMDCTGCARRVRGMAVCGTRDFFRRRSAVVDQSYLSISGKTAFDMIT
ncbi:hypothetical protein ASG92_25980 [Arthrobacter sp. Soil736]|nr:hypothetical protein ASG92_25980 [Arthrobacter sp. Soil736]